MRQRLFQMMTSILLMSVLGGCGADDESAKTKCAKLACDAGATMCFGNIAATCNDDGTQWNTEDCGMERGCVDVDGTFRCKSRDARCFGATDQAFCVEGNVRALVQCSANGTAAESITCDLSCAGGACREAPCEPGATVCGFRSIATCMENGVSWEHTACGESEVCVDGACVAETCAPLSRGCKDDQTIQNCNADGTAYVETACEKDEVCDPVTGSCALPLCNPPSSTDGSDGADGADSPDATGTDADDATDGGAGDEDTYEPPPLEPLDKALVNVNGAKINFTSNKGANYVVADQDLRITMDKGQTKIEISISPIEEFDVGVFSSTEASDVSVRIFYHDGSPLQGMAQFRYQSVDYLLDLESFQAKGGRVKGTFSGTFTEDGGATTIPFEGGEFDVKRNL